MIYVYLNIKHKTTYFCWRGSKIQQIKKNPPWGSKKAGSVKKKKCRSPLGDYSHSFSIPGCLSQTHSNPHDLLVSASYCQILKFLNPKPFRFRLSIIIYYKLFISHEENIVSLHFITFLHTFFKTHVVKSCEIHGFPTCPNNQATFSMWNLEPTQVLKEGGKRGVEIEGAADMGGLQCRDRKNRWGHAT